MHRVSRRSVLVVWCVELFELQRGILCGLVGELVVVELRELCCWVLLGGWCKHVFWLRWRLLPRSLGRSCVRRVFRWVLRGNSLRGVLRLRCGDFRVVLRGHWLPLVRFWLVHVVDGSERVRVVLRRDLPAKHRLDELCELPRGDLPEHDRRDILDALRGLRGGAVRCVGVGGMRLLRRWVVLGCGRRGVLELRRGHLPVCVGVGVMPELRRGVVLHLGGVISDDSVPLGELLLRRQVGDRGLRRGDVLRRRGECLLELRLGHLPAERLCRRLSRLRARELLPVDGPIGGDGLPFRELLLGRRHRQRPLRRRVVLCIIGERMLELRGGHLPGECELDPLLIMSRGVLLHDKRPLCTVVVSGWKLLRRRRLDHGRVRGGDLLDDLGESVLELRGGLLPARLKRRVLRDLRRVDVLRDHWPERGGGVPRWELLHGGVERDGLLPSWLVLRGVVERVLELRRGHVPTQHRLHVLLGLRCW